MKCVSVYNTDALRSCSSLIVVDLFFYRRDGCTIVDYELTKPVLTLYSTLRSLLWFSK